MPDASRGPRSTQAASTGAWREELRTRLDRLQLTPAREAEIIEELSQHLDQRYQELRDSGTGDAEARRLVLDELRDHEALARHMRTLRQAAPPLPITPGAPRRFLLGDTWQDLRYAARVLRKQPGFAAAAILTLALGIGANSAIFALVDATLLRPLPFPNPDRLVSISERTEASPRQRVSPLNLVDWSARATSFEAMGGHSPNVGGMVLTAEDGTGETIPRQWVTAGVFDALGVTPIVGRTFTAEDNTRRADVAVLSESFWRLRFNADPGIVGRDLRLDGDPFTVVGVVPDEAQVMGRTSIWALASTDGLPPTARRAYSLQVIGRMKPGVTLAAADADLASVTEALAREYPTTNAGRGATLQSMHAATVGPELRKTSILFLAVVAFVLLICCANVANLLLTRATARRRELALRSVLGADRRRMIRQLLTESLLLAAIGGALGLALGAAILRVAPAVIPRELLPPSVTLAFDMRLVAFSAATALLVGLLFGLAPAWQGTRLSAAPALASHSRSTTARGGIRDLLVAGEVAAAVLLLFGAGLLLRTLLAVDNVDRGYRAESALTMLVDPLGSSYPTPETLSRFFANVEEEITAVPGVRGAAWASTLPLGRSDAGQIAYEIVGDPPPPASTRPTADYQIVSSTYFETLDLPLVAGRAFADRDAADSARVCIVNEAFVRRHLQGRSPLGVRVSLRSASNAQAEPVVREIVGVARQVKGRPDEAESFMQIYVPLAQSLQDDMYLLVAPSSGRAEALAPSVRAAIGRVDREGLVSVRDVATLDGVARDATARHRFRAVLVLSFAVLALLLAMIGLFGILAHTVQQQVRDFGVRRALGASTADVLWLVAGRAGRVMGLGAGVGLALSVVFGRLLASMLFGVQPLDPLTFAFVGGVLTLTAAGSTLGPAWHAARIDPAIALRGE